MSESPAKQLILPWAAPALLVITALLQMNLAKSEDSRLNPWKGGGFGMFADHHRTYLRTLKIAVVAERDVPILSVVLQNLAPVVRQHLASPTQLSLEEAVASQTPKTVGTALEPVWKDIARRCQVGPLSDAFAAHRSAFGDEFINRVRQGELSNTLPSVLTQLGVEIQGRPDLEPRMPSEAIEIVPGLACYADRIESLKTLPSQARLDAFAEELSGLEWRAVDAGGKRIVFPAPEQGRRPGSKVIRVSKVGVAVYEYDYNAESTKLTVSIVRESANARPLLRAAIKPIPGFGEDSK